MPSVINGTRSVFASQEAARSASCTGRSSPGDIGLLKPALTLNWFDLDGQAFYQLINTETAIDSWMSRFLSYYQDWQQTGLMAMMQRLLAQKEWQISKTPMAERQLTNLYHLIELVQQAAVDEHLAINKTLDWLRTAITKADQ